MHNSFFERAQCSQGMFLSHLVGVLEISRGSRLEVFPDLIFFRRQGSHANVGRRRLREEAGGLVSIMVCYREANGGIDDHGSKGFR